MSVGDPVDEVEHDEDRGGYPHGPGVDIVHQRLLPRSQSQLDVLKIFMSDKKKIEHRYMQLSFTQMTNVKNINENYISIYYNFNGNLMSFNEVVRCLQHLNEPIRNTMYNIELSVRFSDRR